jgi:hypothetical protein
MEEIYCEKEKQMISTKPIVFQAGGTPVLTECRLGVSPDIIYCFGGVV